MVRKVNLDILEVDLQQTGAEAPREEPVPEVRETAPPQKWGRLGKALVISSSLFLLLSIGLTVWFQVHKKPGVQESEMQKSAILSDGLEYMERFAIDLKDDRGNFKVLLCDIALELNQGASITKEKTDIRRTIYRTLKSKNIDKLILPKAKKGLKKEIESELEKVLGGKIVKQVYFTRFTVL
ncbi:MAG: flagellar basal body-associated protein FliL [Syntrophales bacterium]